MERQNQYFLGASNDIDVDKPKHTTRLCDNNQGCLYGGRRFERHYRKAPDDRNYNISKQYCSGDHQTILNYVKQKKASSRSRKTPEFCSVAAYAPSEVTDIFMSQILIVLLLCVSFQDCCEYLRRIASNGIWTDLVMSQN